jgi:hypothetical protein
MIIYGALLVSQDLVATDGICLPLLDGGDVLVVEEHLEPLLSVVVTQLLEGCPSWPKVSILV